MRQVNSSEASVAMLARAGRRYLLLLAGAVGALLLAPGTVRLGPSEREISDTNIRAGFWRKLVDAVGPTESAWLPHHRHSGYDIWPQEIRILTKVEAERAKRQLAAQDPDTYVGGIRSERGQVLAAMRWLELPEVVSHDVLEEEARRHEHAAFELKSMRLGATLGMLILLLTGAGGAWFLAKRGQALIPTVGGSLPPSTLRRLLRGLSRAALIGAAMAAGGAVTWLFANLKWSPERAFIGLFVVLGSCALLIRTCLRLRKTWVGLEKNPEILAELRVQRFLDLASQRQAQLSLQLDGVRRRIQEQQAYVESLRVTAPLSPAVQEAEQRVAGLVAEMQVLEVRHRQPLTDHLGQFKSLTDAIATKREHLRVLTANAAPAEVLNEALAAIDALRARFADLAQHAEVCPTCVDGIAKGGLACEFCGRSLVLPEIPPTSTVAC